MLQLVFALNLTPAFSALSLLLLRLNRSVSGQPAAEVYQRCLQWDISCGAGSCRAHAVLQAPWMTLVSPSQGTGSRGPWYLQAWPGAGAWLGQ